MNQFILGLDPINPPYSMVFGTQRLGKFDIGAIEMKRGKEISFQAEMDILLPYYRATNLIKERGGSYRLFMFMVGNYHSNIPWVKRRKLINQN